MIPDKDRCCQTIWGARVQSWQCSRRAVVVRGGKRFCKLHDPEAVKARQEASSDRYQRERAVDVTRWEVVNAVISARPEELPPAVREARARYLRALEEVKKP